MTTYIGIIEWSKPNHHITEHTIVATTDNAAVEHFREVAHEGHGEVICVHAMALVYSRPPGP